MDIIYSCFVKIPSRVDEKRLLMLRDKYQIPNKVNPRLPALGEYLNSLGVGIHEAYLLGGLRVPLNAFARELLYRLGIEPNQLKPNGWRTIMAIQVLWRKAFNGNHPFTVDKFLFCYKPSKISQSIDFYQSSARGSNCRLVRSLP